MHPKSGFPQAYSPRSNPGVRTPAVPPAYRPQQPAASRAAQLKKAGGPPLPPAFARHAPAAPRAFRPQLPAPVQPKMALARPLFPAAALRAPAPRVHGHVVQRARVITDAAENTSIRNEMFTGVTWDPAAGGGAGAMVANAVAAPGTLNHLEHELNTHPHVVVMFGIMLRTPNWMWDKLKGEDGHAAVQLFIPSIPTARVQAGLGGKGQIALEQFADNYAKDTDKYTISVYKSTISHQKAAAVIAKLRADAGSGHAYSRFAHAVTGKINCATWAISVARAAGFTFPVTYLTGSNPLYLGWTLKTAMWDRTEYTLANRGGVDIDVADEALAAIR